MKKLILILPVLVVGAVMVGCPAFPDACDYGACIDGGSPDGTLPDGKVPEDAKPDTAPPAGCDTPNEPLKNPEKCLVDAFGAFVSPTGDDANPGTKAKPFRTIGKALGTTQPRIVVCEGTYAEAVEVTRDVALLSGVDCGFSRAAGKAKIVAQKPEGAIRIAKPAKAVFVRDIEAEAIDGTAASPNSVAVVIDEVASVSLVGVTATAKKGFDGAEGVAGTTGVVSNLAAIGGNINGNPATGGTNAGPSKACICSVGGTTAGGAGGTVGGNGQDGTPLGGASGKGGMASTNCLSGGAGGTGASMAPIAGAGKQVSLGSVS